MLNLSKCTVKLGKSALYRRIAVLIYLSAGLTLLYSAFIFPVKLFVLALLFIQLITIVCNPVPGRSAILNYNNTNWLLYDKDNNYKSYDKLRILIDTDLFFLLELKAEKRRKLLIIFMDQLSEHEFRVLRLIEKTN